MGKSRKKSWKKLPADYYSGQGEYSGALGIYSRGQGAQNVIEEEEEEFPPLLHTIFEPSEEVMVGQGVAQELPEEEQRPHCSFCFVEDIEENLIRPCLEISLWHYGCLCYWITASNDRNCGVCNQKYQDPRIRRVGPSFWDLLQSFGPDRFQLSVVVFCFYSVPYYMLWDILNSPIDPKHPNDRTLYFFCSIVVLIYVNIGLGVILFYFFQWLQTQRNHYRIIFTDLMDETLHRVLNMYGIWVNQNYLHS